VERIEVTKGPTAEHSAQAVGGTINIILREAPRQRQRELTTRMGYSAVRPTLGFNGTYGDRLGALSLALPVSGFQWRNAWRGWGERRAPDILGEPQHLLTQRHEEEWGGGFNFSPRLNWKLSDTDSLNWQSFLQKNQFNSRGQVATVVLQGEPPVSTDDRWQNHGFWQMARTSLQWVRRWEDGTRLDAKVGGQVSRSHFETSSDGLDARGVQTLRRETSGDNRDNGASTSGKLTRPLQEAHTLALGWDVEQRHRREVRSSTENGQPLLVGIEGEPFLADIQRAALYIQDEWAMSPQWSSYLGLRGERITTTSRGTGDALVSRNQVLTPVLHLNYKLDAKGRDLIRGSVTRSFKAPDPGQLLARPNVNANYPRNTTNPQSAPDRIGNPALEPELATGLDIAFEKYFTGGGLMSIGAFHRRIEGLMRNVVTLQDVGWASAPRWVSRPTNLATASTTGLEFELKGRAAQLLAALPGQPLAGWLAPGLALDVRASFSLYHSRVDGIPGPDNRLESQQPYAFNLGFDHVLKGRPLTWGSSVSYTPAYRLQQTVAQAQEQGVERRFDAYALWAFDRQTSLRLSLNNIAALDGISRTVIDNDDGPDEMNYNRRRGRTSVQAALTMKF